MAAIEPVTVRTLSDDPDTVLRECEECVRIQKEVGWGSEGVSSHILRADSIGLIADAVDLGYVLVAERSSSGEIVGFARVTYTADPTRHWLHEVAVSPSSQGHGVGYAIMTEVRRRSRSAGASFLFFTYDPLDARNGNLYLTKCGGRGMQVFQNLYGLKTEGSSRNRLSHRLLVRWDLDGQAVLFESSYTAEMRSVRGVVEIPNGKPFTLEVPSFLPDAGEENILEWQRILFPVLYESINRMGYEAAYVVRGKEDETARLVLEPRVVDTRTKRD